jgi:hypothetical protein
MKKMLLIIACMATMMCVNAQIKVGTNGNVAIADAVNSTYRLQVAGQARFNADWIGLILGWSSDDYCPAIYTEYNNAMWVGYPNKWANHLWCYNIDYQNLSKLSDVRLKENIQSCSSLLTKLKEVRTYTYNYTDEYFKDFTSEQKQKAQRKEFGFYCSGVGKNIS